jgi:hypothetical protein
MPVERNKSILTELELEDLLEEAIKPIATLTSIYSLLGFRESKISSICMKLDVI